MRKRQMWIPTALCALALGGPPALATADQGKGKGHAKHAADHPQKKDKAHKNKNKQKDKYDDDRDDRRDRDDHRVGTSGAGMRFRGLDVNNDGVISRREWRGNDVSFANHDWNRDGVLSGDEVRPGAAAPEGWRRDNPVRPGGDPDAATFARLDRNNNGLISRGEWNQSAEEFARLDFDRNGVLSPYEFGVGR